MKGEKAKIIKYEVEKYCKQRNIPYDKRYYKAAKRLFKNLPADVKTDYSFLRPIQ